MNNILEYILANYTWILGAIIIILLAIIGSYADKTNFGQGKTESNDEDSITNNEGSILGEDQTNIRINDLFEGKTNSDLTEELNTTDVNNNLQVEVNQNVEHNSILSESNQNNEGVSFDETFDRLNQEVEEVLPEKELVDDDLLEEIDNLSLDKTQKIKIDDIPDLDDVELPKIKNLKSDDGDVWKF